MPVEPSLEAFAAARGGALVRFAFVLSGDSESAKDLVQSAFAKVMRRWPAIVQGGNPEAYMRRVIVTEHVSSHRRPWSRERVTEQLPESRAESDS
jgi:DNA-directed RNA polymerase specialized sigma24 family protein